MTDKKIYMAVLFDAREDFRGNVPISLQDLSFITDYKECKEGCKRNAVKDNFTISVSKGK